MNNILFNEMLNGVIANAPSYIISLVTLYLVIQVSRRQVTFERFCHQKFHEIEIEFGRLWKAIDDIRAELRDLRKDMNHGFHINDLKHEVFEEKIGKLERDVESLKPKA